ncbi:MAG: Flp family type IVb pilin [Bauldia sp.]
MKALFTRFAKDESGSAVIEYGLIAALIGIGILAAASALGGALESTLPGVGTGVPPR